MDNIKPDQTFFTLRYWRDNKIERELIKKIYSTNLLTPRERRTLAVYHSATYLRFYALQKHFQSMLEQLKQPTANSEEQKTLFLVELENNCSSVIRSAWSVFDSLAHEINLVVWKVSNRKELFHPYIKEKKISFYMVRERLLASDKLEKTKISQLLARQTRDIDLRAKEYVWLSELATRALHRPILLGHNFVLDKEGQIQIFLTEPEGLPADSATSLQDFEIVSGLAQISKWLETFIDEVYAALIISL